MTTQLRELYPSIEPYDQGFLPVSRLHTIYYEQCGNPHGRPIIFLHGGPGGGVQPSYRQFFNPKYYRIILFDQRGCGQSTPFGEIEENTTWDLVADMEKIRTHLHIDQWMVFGGSWGSTLALSYAVTHPQRTLGLILRGIFLLRQRELHWFYQEGASMVFPDDWEHYLAPIPESERKDMIAAYYKRLCDPDHRVRTEAAKAWSIWEGSTNNLLQNDQVKLNYGDDHFAYAFARIECHYFINKGFFPEDNFLLSAIRANPHLSQIPCHIIQGRYDMVCPMMSAWDLGKAMPQAQLKIIKDAGHSMNEPGIRSALIESADFFIRDLL